MQLSYYIRTTSASGFKLFVLIPVIMSYTELTGRIKLAMLKALWSVAYKRWLIP